MTTLNDNQAEWRELATRPAKLAPHPWDEIGPPQPLDPEPGAWECTAHERPHRDPAACERELTREIERLQDESASLERRRDDLDDEINYVDDQLELYQKHRRALDRRTHLLPGQLGPSENRDEPLPRVL